MEQHLKCALPCWLLTRISGRKKYHSCGEYLVSVGRGKWVPNLVLFYLQRAILAGRGQQLLLLLSVLPLAAAPSRRFARGADPRQGQAAKPCGFWSRAGASSPRLGPSSQALLWGPLWALVPPIFVDKRVLIDGVTCFSWLLLITRDVCSSPHHSGEFAIVIK